jgi:hypothetical protein
LARALSTDGTWRDGKAAPRLLDERLRGLPADFVTQDPDRPDAVHAIDLEAQPHAAEEIVADRVKAEKAQPKDLTLKEQIEKLWAPGVGERGPVTQWFVDIVRARVGMALAREMVTAVVYGDAPAFWHLDFPDPRNVNEYGLQKGKPPHKSARAKHLRDIETTIDLLDPIPRSIRKALEERGVPLPNTDLRGVMRSLEQAKDTTRLWLPNT